MICPHCGADNDHVVDSRAVQDGRAVRRRRECEQCEARFTTYERFEASELLVEKRSGVREPFDLDKLLAGVRKAFVNRPATEETLMQLVGDVEDTVRSWGKAVISSADLGKELLERMRGVDDVAYLRFASVYKDFKELNDFERELGLIQKKVPPKSKVASGSGPD